MLVLVVVQPVGVLLKFSFNNVVVVLEFDVALDVKFTEPPAQIVEALEEAETTVGLGKTVNVLDAVAVPQLPPLEVNVKVTVPV